MLEEDRVLAVDSVTEFPVERVSVYCRLEMLKSRLADFKANPIKTGWERYFDKWKSEGVKVRH